MALDCRVLPECSAAHSTAAESAVQLSLRYRSESESKLGDNALLLRVSALSPFVLLLALLYGVLGAASAVVTMGESARSGGARSGGAPPGGTCDVIMLGAQL